MSPMKEKGECRWIRGEELEMHGVRSVTRSLYLGNAVRMCCLASRSPSPHATGSVRKNVALYSLMGAWKSMTLMALAHGAMVCPTCDSHVPTFAYDGRVSSRSLVFVMR